MTTKRNINGQYKPHGMSTRQKVLTTAAFTCLATLFVYGKYITPPQFISPVAEHQVRRFAVYAEERPVTPTGTQSEHDQIADYIREVFGKDAPKAFKLLSCENGRLNPNAINVNKDSEKTQDVGIFQINTKWQGVTNKAFLTDYKVNILMAHNIYQRSGNTFKMWACGQKLGI